MRIAIAHDYLTQRGGAERVVLSLLKAFPGADIYTTLYDPENTFPEFRDVRVHTSPLNRAKPLRQRHRHALPLLPYAVNAMHVDADVVVASSSGWAHGISTSGKKLVYCHTPARWLYAEDDYLSTQSGRMQRVALYVLKRALRGWDRRAAQTVDSYVANSHVSQRRIADSYGIDCDVLFPPHSMDDGSAVSPVPLPPAWGLNPDFLLTVSRLMPYKHVDEVIAAAMQQGRRLVVVGRGPERDRLQALANDQVVFLEGIEDRQLRWLYGSAAALVAASFEDFGLTPVEAAHFGTPTVALRAGGYLDTVTEGLNGLFFDVPSASSIGTALVAAEKHDWSAAAISERAGDFAEAKFIEDIRRRVYELHVVPTDRLPTPQRFDVTRPRRTVRTRAARARARSNAVW